MLSTHRGRHGVDLGERCEGVEVGLDLVAAVVNVAGHLVFGAE